MMTVGELKDILDGMPDEAEVRIASQPSCPFEYAVSDAVEFRFEEFGEGEEVGEVEELSILYIVEGDQLRYLPHDVKISVGWN